MTAITIGLATAALTTIAAITFMILLRFGIHHQKRSGSLRGGPKSLCAALARRILDLRPCPQDDVQHRGPKDHAGAGRSSAESQQGKP
jgi:hypothetical protein